MEDFSVAIHSTQIVCFNVVCIQYFGLYRKLDAFIYDATVLEYLVGQDSDCVLLTVGSWFAMTGYGVGFPRHSKFRDLVNQKLMEYRENGTVSCTNVLCTASCMYLC